MEEKLKRLKEKGFIKQSAVEEARDFKPAYMRSGCIDNIWSLWIAEEDYAKQKSLYEAAIKELQEKK